MFAHLSWAILPLLCGLASVIALANDEPAWIGQSNNAFALGLYAKLAAEDQGNLFFSPNSIQTALAMTYAGAGGETAAQMAAVLHLPPGGEAVHKDFGDFLKELNGPEGVKRGYELSVANALWGQKGYGFLPGFLDLLKTDYGAGLEQVDFKDNSEGARNTINAWVEKQTHDKIHELIGPGVLTAATRLVLTNAVYFKGTWASEFDRNATRDEPFHLAGSQEKDVPMMHRTGNYSYMENEDFQALKLDYAGNELSMIILLPRHMDALPQLEKDLTPKKLADAFGILDDRKVIVSVPKFKMTEQFELNRPLASMGMPAAFHDADFSGMTGKRDLEISNVIHKAFIEVNEEGTVAAAATGTVMRLAMAMPTQPPVFRADHPFLFVIRHEKSGAFLFMGRVMDPGRQ